MSANPVLLTDKVASPSIKSLIARHPITAYFVLAYAGTWLLELPMVLGKDGLGLLSFQVPFPLYVVLFLASSYSGPTAAALLVTSILDGRQGIRHFFRRYVQWRVGVPWYLLVLFMFPMVYFVAASIILGYAPLSGIADHWPAFFTAYLPAVLIFPAFITWGEEPGWRGFALTRLQAKYNPVVSSMVVGLLHGLWHLPVFILVNGPPALGPFDPGRFLLNTFGIMMLSIIWTWIFNNAKGSILIAVLLHASSNATPLLINSLISSFPKQAGIVTLAIYVVTALLLVVVTKGRLSYNIVQPAKPATEL